jgi:hypothetical protein
MMDSSILSVYGDIQRQSATCKFPKEWIAISSRGTSCAGSRQPVCPRQRRGRHFTLQA